MALDEELVKRFEDELAQANNPAAARNVIAFLFPELGKALRITVPELWGERGLRLGKRLASKEYAARYFTFDEAQGEWGINELRELLLRSEPEEAFIRLRRREEQAPFASSAVRTAFFEGLDSLLDARDIELSGALLEQIVIESARLIRLADTDTQAFFRIDNLDRLSRILLVGLERIEDLSLRTNIVHDAILNATDLTLLCDVLRTILGDANPLGARRQREFFLDADRLVSEMIVRIREKTENFAIFDQARPSVLIWFWWGANRVDEVRRFVNAAIEIDRYLLQVLEFVPGIVVSSSEGAFERVQVDTWSNIVDLEKLEHLAMKLAKSGVQAEVDIAERFLEALRRGRMSQF